MSGRLGAGPLRGIALLPSSLLGAVLGARARALAHARGVERGAHDLVANAGQVLNPSAAHQNHGVLLEVVTDARDVGGHLDAGAEPYSGDLAEGRVRFLGGVRVYAGAHPAPLGRPLEGRRFRLLFLALPALADQLLDRRHVAPLLPSPARRRPRIAGPARAPAFAPGSWPGLRHPSEPRA